MKRRKIEKKLLVAKETLANLEVDVLNTKVMANEKGGTGVMVNEPPHSITNMAIYC